MADTDVDTDAGEGESRKKRARVETLEVILRKQIEEYRCPITVELIACPVTAEDGQHYERAAITRWLKDHATSPVTNEPMGATLLPSHQASNVISGLISSGVVSPSDEAAWQVRKGLHVNDVRPNGVASTTEAMRCFERAKSLGSDDGKFHYARLLMQQAADAGHAEAAQYVAVVSSPLRDDLAGSYFSSADRGYKITVTPDRAVTFNGVIGVISHIIEESDILSFNGWDLDEEKSTPGRLLWKSRVPLNNPDGTEVDEPMIWWFRIDSTDVLPNYFSEVSDGGVGDGDDDDDDDDNDDNDGE